eukprot:363811-Chlamydomonas_euryale.AAC.4
MLRQAGTSCVAVSDCIQPRPGAAARLSDTRHVDRSCSTSMTNRLRQACGWLWLSSWTCLH